MNIYRIENEYYLFSVHNLGFIGSYRCHGSRIDGHYTIILKYNEHSNDNSFFAWKHGTYSGLTSFKPLPFELLELNDIEVKQFNDVIFKNFNPKNVYNSDKPMSGNTIFEFSPSIHDKEDVALFHSVIDLLKTNKGYKYQQKRISPNIQMGDNVIDTRNNETFKVKYFHDLKVLNMHHYYHLTDRENMLDGCIENLPNYLSRFQVRKLKDAIENGVTLVKRKKFTKNPVGLQYSEIFEITDLKLKKSKKPHTEVTTKGDTFKYYWHHPSNDFFVITKNDKIIWVDTGFPSHTNRAFIAFTEMFPFYVNGSHEYLTIHGGTYTEYASYWDNGKNERNVHHTTEEIKVKELYSALI